MSGASSVDLTFFSCRYFASAYKTLAALKSEIQTNEELLEVAEFLNFKVCNVSNLVFVVHHHLIWVKGVNTF